MMSCSFTPGTIDAVRSLQIPADTRMRTRYAHYVCCYVDCFVSYPYNTLNLLTGIFLRRLLQLCHLTEAEEDDLFTNNRSRHRGNTRVIKPGLPRGTPDNMRSARRTPQFPTRSRGKPVIYLNEFGAAYIYNTRAALRAASRLCV